jgi:oligopeptide transport system substrate-binding protein
MTRMVPRRTLLAAAPAALVSCSQDRQYFGTTRPPARHRLVYANGNEPDTFDPGTYAGGTEMRIINALFDGLTKFHPLTLEPMAALATHYEANNDSTRFTFYLRGHQSPRGTRFANTNDLLEEFSRGRKAPPDSIPARWSDGVAITAHDFVYSWRRATDPRTGSADASYFYLIKNGREIHRGKRKPDELGVRALDDFTLEVSLCAPAAHFLAIQSQRVFFPVPRHAVEEGVEWGRVTSGAFRLKERRSYERVVLVRNPAYYEASAVGLDEIVFLPVKHEVLIAMYKAGDVDGTDGAYMPSQFVRALLGRRDFHSSPTLERSCYAINVREHPFDNVLLRYALNMATGKKEIADSLDGGQSPALSCVPPMKGYDSVTSLPVEVDGVTFDVLRYEPNAARALLSRAGFPAGCDSQGKRLTVTLILDGPATTAQILQQQWRRNLNVDVKLEPREFNVWIQMLVDVSYRDLAIDPWTAKYADPAAFLDMYESGSGQNETGWTDPRYDALLAAANTASTRALRMQRLAECERLLLTAMPLIPVHFAVYSSLVKPYVHGWAWNALNEHHFKYVWIDTNWRAQ